MHGMCKLSWKISFITQKLCSIPSHDKLNESMPNESCENTLNEEYASWELPKEMKKKEKQKIE